MGQTFGGGVMTGYGAIAGMRNLIVGLCLTTGAAHADAVVVAALGDSLTAGYGLPTADGFVPQLQEWLDANGMDAQIQNAGVSGDTTAGGLSRTDWTLTPNVDAMIVTLGGNDYLRGLDPQVSRANLRGILEKAQDADVDVLVIGLTAGANYGATYKNAFDAMYGELAEEFDAALVPNFFEGLLTAAGSQAQVRTFMQADGIHPNAAGVREIVKSLGPAVAELVDRAAD